MTQLTTRSAWDSHPVWSPSGTHIAYVSQEVYFDSNVPTNSPPWPPAAIWVMNADGTGATKLSGDVGNDFLPSWSP